MNLADMAAVLELANERSHLVTQRDGDIAISIEGWPKGPEFIAACAPAIRLELRHRIEEIDAQLRSLGVEIGG